MPETTPVRYPTDALAENPELDVINCNDVTTLDEAFRERVRRTPNQTAYIQYSEDRQQWLQTTWEQVAVQVERWQLALRNQGLKKGDRIAICYKNSLEWVVFDQAALRMGLVVVPLYTADRAENVAYVLSNSGARLLFLQDQAFWQQIAQTDDDLSALETVLVADKAQTDDPKVRAVGQWLQEEGAHFERGVTSPEHLASIIYTSGTTGRPKGVMLSHQNLLLNAYAGMRSVGVKPRSRFLSFLPLSHALERTVGYYSSVLSGATVVFNRSIPQLADDLKEIKPHVLVSVPRIFERVHNQISQTLSESNAVKQWLFDMTIKSGWRKFEYQQGLKSWSPLLLLNPLFDWLVARPVRQKLGGKLEFAIIGGAPLRLDVAKTFISLGIPLLQGYGLTESSPVVSVNTLDENRPDSIGLPLRGVKVKLGDNDELLVKGSNVMMGYWGLEQKTADTMDGEWLKTGDRASIDEHGFLRIIGRIKDIIVLANGEKVPPADIEEAILQDSLFEQVMVVGEGHSFLAALAVLNQAQWQQLCKQQGFTENDLQSDQVKQLVIDRITKQMEEFPGYAKIRKVSLMFEEWTLESGLLTPTLKIKRPKVAERFKAEIDQLYEGHGVRKI